MASAYRRIGANVMEPALRIGRRGERLLRRLTLSFVLCLLALGGCEGAGRTGKGPEHRETGAPRGGAARGTGEEKTHGGNEVWLKIRGHPLRAEIADTPERRRRGLMFRENLPPNRGMLFIFPEEDYHGFWMKNTGISLSIAFISRNGRIRQIEVMEPMSEEIHSSRFPVKYALEVNRGWFSQFGIQAGHIVTGLPEAN
jgi:uncharacterized membrane protein (UPF0127 family)